MIVALPDSGFWPEDPRERFLGIFTGWWAMLRNSKDALPGDSTSPHMGGSSSPSTSWRPPEHLSKYGRRCPRTSRTSWRTTTRPSPCPSLQAEYRLSRALCVRWPRCRREGWAAPGVRKSMQRPACAWHCDGEVMRRVAGDEMWCDPCEMYDAACWTTELRAQRMRARAYEQTGEVNS